MEHQQLCLIKGSGYLGADFESYLGGRPKLGDTPSLLYMMNGDPSDPTGESWGGSFEPCSCSSRAVFYGMTSERDTICTHEIIELHITGPSIDSIEPGTPCLTFNIAGQDWDGYYMGEGEYMIRYCTYRTGTQTYSIVSNVSNRPSGIVFRYPYTVRDCVTYLIAWSAGTSSPFHALKLVQSA